jgi:hypothetical protein
LQDPPIIRDAVADILSAAISFQYQDRRPPQAQGPKEFISSLVYARDRANDAAIARGAGEGGESRISAGTISGAALFARP